jgi:hypothetical protein
MKFKRSGERLDKLCSGFVGQLDVFEHPFQLGRELITALNLTKRKIFRKHMHGMAIKINITNTER